jgi:hypothetical protein
MMTQVELHIGELVLRGLPYGQRDRLAAAVEAELKRLLDEGGLPPSLAAGGTVPEVRVDDLRLAAGARPGIVGTQIAGSIYRSLVGNRPLPGLPGRSTV